MIFLIWAQATAPPCSINLVGTNFIELTAALMMALSIQCIFDTIFIKNILPKQHTGVIKVSFILGVLGCMFISYGCFGTILIIQRLLADHPGSKNHKQWRITLVLEVGKCR